MALIEFVKKGLICKLLKNFKTITSECISSEITICERKWLWFSFYRPPCNENLEVCFEDLTNFFRKANESSEYFIIVGDFNVDVTNRGIVFDKLTELWDLFNLTNLITPPTCFIKAYKSNIDLILTSKEGCFKKEKVTETGLSDFHRLMRMCPRLQFCDQNYTRNKAISVSIGKKAFGIISTKVPIKI